MENKITPEEYDNAYEIVRKYEYQRKPKTIQVSLYYNATVSVTVQVPADWSIEKIREELKEGYYDFEQDDREDVYLGEIVELIVDGEEIDLQTNKIK
jgi:hypothetical protein